MACALCVELPPNGWLIQETPPNPCQPPPAPQEPQSLVARAQAGDRQAFNQLVLSTQGVAYNTAYRVLQDEEAAADVVQEAFIKAYRALGSYRGGSFKSWFLRILMNTCYDLLRVQKRQATSSLDALVVESEELNQWADAMERPEEYAERMELRHWIERGIATLPVDQRAALVLSDVEGYSYQEIVEITGVPLGTVKSRINRGRLRLRDYLLRHRVLPVQQES